MACKPGDCPEAKHRPCSAEAKVVLRLAGFGGVWRRAAMFGELLGFDLTPALSIADRIYPQADPDRLIYLLNRYEVGALAGDARRKRA